jgi:hypothetical protein
MSTAADDLFHQTRPPSLGQLDKAVTGFRKSQMVVIPVVLVCDGKVANAI